MKNHLNIGFSEKHSSRRVFNDAYNAANNWNRSLGFKLFHRNDKFADITVFDKNRQTISLVSQIFAREVTSCVHRQFEIRKKIQKILSNKHTSTCFDFLDGHSALLINKGHDQRHIAHELGHAIGIPHLSGRTIMKSEVGKYFHGSIERNDIEATRLIIEAGRLGTDSNENKSLLAHLGSH